MPDTSEHKYRYWFVYWKPELKEIEVIHDKNDLLYAYTDNKHLIRLFQKQRNMKLFVVKKQYISKGLVNYYAEHWPQLFLIEKAGKTHETESTMMPFRVALTNVEFNSVYSSCQFYLCTLVNRELSEHKLLRPVMLIPEMQYLLYQIQYWNFVAPDFHSEAELMERKHRATTVDEYGLPFSEHDIYPEIDFLMVFVRTFKNTLKK